MISIHVNPTGPINAYDCLVERFTAPHVRGSLVRCLGEDRAAHCELEIEHDLKSGVAIEHGRIVARLTIGG